MSRNLTRRAPKSEAEAGRVCAFLDAQARTWAVTKEAKWESYQSLARGDSGWHRSRFGGTYELLAVVWYQHILRPGSREWRPSIIIEALCRAAGLEG